ncbi:substrate-binding domain-containing protein [uncultured Desulfobacter sp.]|uniref:substrate-binding domain-containing protein n=1 Tax=uncultured Desulfobacter sp. TaxID=240139 RepID=UPI0029F47666|nr:substrate-binding domain-containing protein [uncultured Desulfobacter sp.]
MDFYLNNDLLGPLMEDELDLIVDCRPHNRPDLEYISMLREAYTVVASKYYIEKKEIESVTDLEHCNLISMDKDMIWCQNFINALPKDIPLRLKQVIQIDHIRGIIEACMASIGVGFVPSYTVDKALSSKQLIALFPEIDVFKDQIGIYYKKRVASRPSIGELAGHLQQIKF